MFKCRKGSLTVEAVLILPIFMAIILFLSYFIKAHYVQDVVQDALAEAVMEVSALSYPYHLSGAAEFKKDLESDFDSVLRTIESVAMPSDTAVISQTGIEGITPQKMFRLAKLYAADKAIDTAEDSITRYLILSTMGNVLSVDGKSIVDRMNSLGIENGLDGFDFSGSVFYSDDDEIDIQAQYRLSKVDPFGIIKGVTLKNRVVCQAWMGGVDVDNDGGVNRIDVPPKMEVGEEDPYKDVSRTFRTCYIIRNSSTSNRYHFHDCSSLKERSNTEKMKTVAAVQVPFIKADGIWKPEEASITHQGKVYTFCTNCRNGTFRADGEKSEEPLPYDSHLVEGDSKSASIKE